MNNDNVIDDVLLKLSKINATNLNLINLEFNCAKI